MTGSGAVIRLHAADNVAVARRSLAAGELFGEAGQVALDPIAAGHKVAIGSIGAGRPVRRYGQVIGFAKRDIALGEHVHKHNLAMEGLSQDYGFAEDLRPAPPVEKSETFLGIRRPDGRIATRNYIAVISTVNCSATVAKRVAHHFATSGELHDFSNVDGIVPLTHSFGCCIDHNGKGLGQLRRTIGGYLRHPNFAAVVIVGLGCEANQLKPLLASAGGHGSPQVAALVMQEVGGTQKTIDAAIAAVRKFLPAANDVERGPLPLSHLTVALQCGGSDGYSGITANPALGYAVDKLVAHGGTAILSETPEIYGAEHLLTRRAVSREVGEKLLDRIRWWEAYAEREQGSLDNNPTPGNLAGGLTTILEKSLGAVAKSGTTPLTSVLQYAEPVDAHGLVFMDAPGYDPMGATGQIASGANLVAFTTGRGSCFGAKPAPVLKIATNTAIYERMSDDMDVNCGSILDGESSVERMGEEIFAKLIALASGNKSKSEDLGIGDEEFVPWMIGAQM